MRIALKHLRGIAAPKRPAAVAPKRGKAAVSKRSVSTSRFQHLREANIRALQRVAARRANGPNDVGEDENQDENRDGFKDTDELVGRSRELMPELFRNPSGAAR
jgi:hypothetical protein